MQLFIKMYYIVITKKKNNEMCAIRFLKACTLSCISSIRVTFYIQNCFYSELLEKKNFSRVPNLKKLYLEICKYHIEKKRVDYFRNKKAKKNISSKKNFWLNLSWNDPYVYILLFYHIGMMSWKKLFFSYAIYTCQECVLKLFEESGNVICL